MTFQEILDPQVLLETRRWNILMFIWKIPQLQLEAKITEGLVAVGPACLGTLCQT